MKKKTLYWGDESLMVDFFFSRNFEKIRLSALWEGGLWSVDRENMIRLLVRFMRAQRAFAEDKLFVNMFFIWIIRDNCCLDDFDIE